MKLLNRSHFISIFLNTLVVVKSTFMILVLLLLFQEEDSLILCIYFSLLFTFTVLHFFAWRKRIFRLEDDVFKMNKGIFLKEEINYPFSKIQGINFSSNVFLDFLKLEYVSIEVYGSQEAERVVLLVKKEIAKEIYENVFPSSEFKKSNIKKNTTKLFKIQIKDLLLMGVTSFGSLFTVYFAFTTYQQYEAFIPDSIRKNISNSFLFSGVKYFEEGLNGGMDLHNILLFGSSILLLFALGWLIGIVSNALKYAKFTVEREKEQIQISYGLFTTKTLGIPIKNIQYLTVQETLLHQLFGFCKLEVQSVGVGTQQGTSIIYPFLKKKDIKLFIEEIIPEIKENNTFVKPPKRALFFYLVRGIVLPLIIIYIFSMFYKWVNLLFILTPFLIVLSYWRHKDSGVYMNEKLLYLRKRTVRRETSIFFIRSLQSFNLIQSPIQEKLKLGNYEIATATENETLYFKVKDLEISTYEELLAWYYDSFNLEQ